MRTLIIYIFLVFASPVAIAQKVWTADRCMQYAVDHNHKVIEKTIQLNNYRQDETAAWGELLPQIKASVVGQLNFGRSVDPETNTYNNISTFNNGYSLEASWTLFRGGSLLQEISRSHAARRMGQAALDEARERIALETYDAYIQATYLDGTIRLSEEKLAQTDSLLKMTEKMEELGLKSKADVSQIVAQQASDKYQLVTQRNLYGKAIMSLKRIMNLEQSDSLQLDTKIFHLSMNEEIQLNTSTPLSTFDYALQRNSSLLLAAYNVDEARYAYRKTLSSFLPTVTLYGGLSTSYYKMISGGQYPDFSMQLRNNFGQYVAVGLSIPLFSQLSALTSRRKARNTFRMAQERYDESKKELLRLINEAYMDRDGALAESLQLEAKVKADEWAYHTLKRKYEEGLASSLDVQQNASTLQDSRIRLLKSRLTYRLKCRLVDYYQGKPLY